MDLKQRAEYYARLRVELNGSRAEDAVETGLDAAAIIKARVQRDGVGADGQRFSDYSPAYARRGRTQLGYQTAYKDFTRSGELFKSVGVEVAGQTQDSVTVAIGPTGNKNVLKAAGALGQGDAIFRLSPDEETDILNAYLRRRRKRYEQ